MSTPTVPTELLVAGEPRAAKDGDTFTVSSPATGEAIAEVSKAGPEDLDAALTAAHGAFESGEW